MHPLVKEFLSGTASIRVDGLDPCCGIVLMEDDDTDPSISSGKSTGVLLYPEFRRLMDIAAPQWARRRLHPEGEPHTALSGHPGPGPVRRDSANELCVELIGNQQTLPDPKDRLIIRRIIELLQCVRCYQF